MWFYNSITLCGFGIKLRYAVLKLIMLYGFGIKVRHGYSVFIKITKNSQKNSCIRASFDIVAG